MVGYKDFVKLDKKYRAQGLRILGFPCNQFKSQEPGTKEEIREFVDKYDVEFQMFKKINVNGSETHDLWKFLKDKKGGGMVGSFIKWNFTKFIIDRDGVVQHRLAPTTLLSSKENAIQEFLNASPKADDEKAKKIDNNL